MAVGDEHVFPGFLTPLPTQISFQSHRQLFSHALAVVRGEIRQREISPQPGLFNESVVNSATNNAVPINNQNKHSTL